MISDVFEVIKANVSVYRETSSDLRIRCIYCGDSKKNPRHVHLYISKKPVAPYNTYVFHCFRAECGASGPLVKLLADMNLISQISKQTLSELLQKSNGVPPFITCGKEFTKEINVSKNVNYEYKYNYVKSRLFCHQIPQFIQETIVSNFTQFQDILNPNIVNLLEKNFVGFKTFDGCKVVCRNISESEFRYYNIFLRTKPDYYIISPLQNKLDLFSSGLIILAEGIFSVLRGYLFLKDSLFKSEKNIVLAASLGGKIKTFENCIRYVQSSLGIPEWSIVILSDPDVPYSKYNVLRRSFRNLKVLYNKHGDFGAKHIELK